MKAVITVTGKDTVGIIAEVAGLCAKHGANIMDITQSVISDYFAMIMLTDINGLKTEFSQFADQLAALGKEKHLDIHAMHEDIFNTMHHV
ncbi:MAG: ACT domain-containing protein [Ruminococcaceae bacterium]|nr:ACT domain-containing protein [Oscillospiraceae bacterium]